MRITLLVLLITVSGWISVTAQPTHTVRAGETLFSISREYGISVQQLREWNHLADNTIRVGQMLIVGDSDDPQSNDVTPDQTSDTITHTVEAGQTLFRISTLYNVSVDDIKAWNQLESNNISIGQRLAIRSGTVAGDAAPVSDTFTGSREGRPAAPPSVSAEWDMESTPQGKFVSYTFGQDDTLEQLLNFHQMDRNDFRALNPGVSPSDIRAGDEITLLLASSSPQRNPYRVRTTDRGSSQIQVSRYPGDRRGKTTTSGDLYNPNALTAAHPSLSLGSVVYVENPDTGHGLYVLINDRTSENRLLLSDAAFRALQFSNASSFMVTIDEQPD